MLFQKYGCKMTSCSVSCDSFCISGHSGLSNPEEFSFTSDEETQEQTIRRQGHHARDQKKLDTLKKKLHTDDECKLAIEISSECVIQGNLSIVVALKTRVTMNTILPFWDSFTWLL